MTPAGLYTLNTVLDRLASGPAAPRPDSSTAPGSAAASASPGSPAAPASAGSAGASASFPAPGVAGGAEAPGGRGSAAATSAAAGAALALPLVADDSASAPTALSGLAQLINRIGSDARGAGALPPAALPAPITDGGMLAEALPDAIRAAVQESGVFYESHLEDWLAGRRPLEDVLREPQARLAQRHPGDAALPGAASPARVPEAGMAPAGPASAESRATEALNPGQVAGQSAETARTPGAQEPWQLPRALEPMVREQLSVLAQGALSVPLNPWPGQDATLEVRDDARAPGAEENAASAVRVSLKMTLPELGRVEFVLSAQGGAIRIAAAAEDAASRSVLARRGLELRDALAARALTLDALEVANRAG